MKLSKADFKEKLARFPLGSQDGKGFDAVCIAHFFIAAAHWFVSEMETEGDDMGHADFSTTMDIYTDVSERFKQRSVEKIQGNMCLG